MKHMGDHLPFLETSSPLHPCKLFNYTGKSWRVRKGERGRIREKEHALSGGKGIGV